MKVLERVEIFREYMDTGGMWSETRDYFALIVEDIPRLGMIGEFLDDGVVWKVLRPGFDVLVGMSIEEGV